MPRTIEQIVSLYRQRIKRSTKSVKAGDKGAKSNTSLLAVLYNNGCVVCSDLQATYGHGMRASVREKKIYQMGDNPVVIAGTGTSADITFVANAADMMIQDWKSEWDLKDASPEVAGEIINEILNVNHGLLEAYFLLGGFDHAKNKPFIANIDGELFRSDIFQTDGSGSIYIMSKAQELSDKVLGTLTGKGINPVTVDDIYEVLDKLNFPREVAMVESLAAINGGPTCDIYSGGLGYQMFVIDDEGLAEYIIPSDMTKKILEEKQKAEFAAISPRLRKGYDQEKVMRLFEKTRRR
ncbi:hypothetical protein ACFL96_05100 [Thermoproteota archaeon]